MNELEVVGLLVGGIIVLGSFIAVIIKLMQPINELRVAVQRFTDKLDTLIESDKAKNKRLDEHDEKFEKMNERIAMLETKMCMYHHDK